MWPKSSLHIVIGSAGPGAFPKCEPSLMASGPRGTLPAWLGNLTVALHSSGMGWGKMDLNLLRVLPLLP